MVTKWIILDEIKLELIKDKDENIMLFDYKAYAITYAEKAGKYLYGWQIIEVPFGE